MHVQTTFLVIFCKWFKNVPKFCLYQQKAPHKYRNVFAYIQYDYVQHCEDTVAVKLHNTNKIIIFIIKPSFALLVLPLLLNNDETTQKVYLQTFISLTIQGFAHLNEERGLLGGELDVRFILKDVTEGGVGQRSFQPQSVVSHRCVLWHLKRISKF